MATRHGAVAQNAKPAVLRAAMVALILATATNHCFAADYLCKTVGKDWTWFSDHVVGSISYLVVAAPNRTFEAGTGVFFRNRPWGTKASGSGTLKMTAYGAGALHIRQHDAGDPFKICATSQAIEAITIISAEF